MAVMMPDANIPAMNRKADGARSIPPEIARPLVQPPAMPAAYSRMTAPTKANNHRFQVCEPGGGPTLSEHLEIHTVELQKWRPSEARPLAAQDRWVYFLREARGWYKLPGDLDSPEMRKAMSVIERWSQREADYRA